MKTLSTSLDSMEPVFEKIGLLSKVQRILICAGAFVLLVGGFFYFSYLPKMQKIQALSKQKADLTQQLTTIKGKASQLKSYREQMKKAEDDFLIAKAVLPETQEIPSLLANISQSGQDAGLEFLLFQPKPEVKKDFYAEIPVDIKISGGYHQVAMFFDNVSRLHRIVNITNIEMKAGQKGAALDTSCTAVTYKFVEAPPPQPADPKAATKRTRKN